MIGSEVANARAARDRLNLAIVAAGAARDKVDDHKSRLAAANAELARALDLEREDNVRRILDGDDARPVKPRRLSRIENLRNELAGLEGAIPVLQDRADDAAAAVEKARVDFNTTLLPIIAAARSTAADRLRDQMRALAPAIAALLAIDIVQARILGEKFEFHGAISDVFSARIVVEKLLGGIGGRIRAPDLSSVEIERAAGDIAARFVAEIEG